LMPEVLVCATEDSGAQADWWGRAGGIGGASDCFPWGGVRLDAPQCSRPERACRDRVMIRAIPLRSSSDAFKVHESKWEVNVHKWLEGPLESREERGKVAPGRSSGSPITWAVPISVLSGELDE
jgi:hypothetical protein